MRSFTLRAKRANGTYSTRVFLSSSDKEAIVSGAFMVMRLAYPNREPWANGQIELVNDLGVIIAEMGAKQ